METAHRLSPLTPLARAYERAVAEDAKDDGLYGPRSIVWRVHRDRSFPLAGLRSLMIQALHPLAMAGVAQHSTWRQDPFGRLAATSSYLLTTTYGDTEAALAAAAWVRKIHVHVRGTDPETGLPYSAEDPDLLLWVHAGMVDSIVEVVQRYGRELEPGDADRYVAEMVRFAEIVGVPTEDVPTTVASLRAYIESVEMRQASAAAKEAIGVLLDPDFSSPGGGEGRGGDAELRDLYRDLAQVAVGTLPDWAREMYGYTRPPAEVMEREGVRQLLGALDIAFESLPGVIEARQRIELRIRA
jgi:uncharacterized protein (DUF2236 family)